MFGKSLSDRARLMDEGLDVITRTLAGERFMYADREIFVRPLPRSHPPSSWSVAEYPRARGENTERVTQRQILAS